MTLPSISIIIPTYNSSRKLPYCLKSIMEQNYPKELIEIIIADAGSHDSTIKIARQYANKILNNPLKTGEAGKAMAIKQAKNEIIALIDSDNILPQKDWFRKMVQPFTDPEIIGSEPIRYTYRPQDSLVTRYSALMGMNDPLCYFLGNYDRENLISGKWTALPILIEDRENYIKFQITSLNIPTIGANGFLIRKKCIDQIKIGDYFFDIDTVYGLLQKGYSHYAKVKIGIIHIYANDVSGFIKKQQRRVKDYLFYQKNGLRAYPWKTFPRTRLLKFIGCSLSLFPTVFQSFKGYSKKQDLAWFFHPFACFFTLLIYGGAKIKSLFLPIQIQSRKNWRIR